MRFLRVSALALCALAAPAAAQNLTFLTQFLQQLQALNLTSLVNATTAVNATSTGQRLLSALSDGPLTVFAPNNDGWAGAHPNITSNADLLADVLSYHVVPGTFGPAQAFPNTTVGRTLLNDSDLVFLEGGKSQVLAWAAEGGTTHILNQNTPVIVTNSTTFGNITLHVTTAVIDVPGDLLSALAANNLTSFRTALQSTSLLDTVNTLHGVTVFAPTDAAFAAAQQSLTGVSGNTTELTAVLLNHVLNGTSVYSGDLLSLATGSANATTAAGEGIRPSFNSSGTYVTGGSTTARITTPDIVLWSGVVHIVDAVLFDNATDTSAAVSA
ncbi:hypothetical protein M0805_009179 [Coniferiporia weirii]|nr:hypothetical protein M0805_009179 [Coniferiporia weirii]